MNGSSALGQGVKKGTVKSGEELNKTYCKVDHAIAIAWHRAAAEAQKADKDSNGASREPAQVLRRGQVVRQQANTRSEASVDAVKKSVKARRKA